MSIYQRGTGISIRALLERYGIRPVKTLGQNFLTDPNIVRKIIESAELNRDDTVCEIGPGFGALTAELAARSSRVVAVEKDARLALALADVLGRKGIIPCDTEPGSPSVIANSVERGDARDRDSTTVGNIDIVCADFLDYDLGSLPRTCKLVGNLPYRVTTPILMKAISAESLSPLMVFMIQREVAQRICAPPGGRDYGAVSVAIQYRCDVRYAFDVSREVFIPKPNVDSAVIVLKGVTHLHGRPRDEDLFSAVVRAGFSKRRKMLRNALAALVPNADALEAAFVQAGVKGTARAETLSVEEFIALADAVHDLSASSDVVNHSYMIADDERKD
ncbi:MAG: 16S rRNA (adenine(1518)-N(6)/adenine(1519)-N(6))-dimethyltransferase [Clostridiales Family XIII bacterium]|jgi:16S rRNA (adenine1518-N6/adenine1519-N6)-dimethyltransferase|nr:16S rRNA (adenine(1518)-N(6)/adenine(1519)-N(6))-dimethyltransferase [Clostridiales Family XIII bacterium]